MKLSKSPLGHLDLLLLGNLGQEELHPDPLLGGPLRVGEKLVLVLLELLGRHAAAHVVLDEPAEDVLGLAIDEALRNGKIALFGEGVDDLPALVDLVAHLLLQLEVRSDLGLQAVEILDLVGLEEFRVDRREDALAHLLDLQGVGGGLPGKGRKGRKLGGKGDLDASSCRPP